jgi:hypothetical protein
MLSLSVSVAGAFGGDPGELGAPVHQAGFRARWVGWVLEA